jgi:succinate dehydrogenase/fumarate reductase flavoprotein subunit
MPAPSDRECDVLVIGLGGAGAAAAIEAHDRGAHVLVVEKNARPGGNTRVTGGSMRAYREREAAFDYIDAVCGRPAVPPRGRAELL